MELRQLRAFHAVALTGQLARASEQLHLTKSALSKQIKYLEEGLGVVLFERLSTGVALTSAGRRLLPFATKTLDAAREVNTLAASLRGTVSGDLRLGTMVDPASIRLGLLLATLLQRHPHVDVSLHTHGMSGTIVHMLRHGTVDAGFYLGPVSDPDVAVRCLTLEHYVVVGAASGKHQVENASWEDLAALPWLVTPTGSAQHHLATRMFGERGRAPKAVIEADQESSAMELVRAGVAIGLMRERLAMAEQGSVAIWPGARMPCPLSLLYRRSHEDSVVVQALLATLQVVWPVDENE